MQILIITLVFEKNANFYAENCRKSQKIVIITSTPSRQFSSSDKKDIFSKQLPPYVYLGGFR
jgi:hypothetical protein